MESIIKQALGRNEMKKQESTIVGAGTRMMEESQKIPIFKEPQMIQEEKVIEKSEIKTEAMQTSDAIVGLENISDAVIRAIGT